MSNRDTIRALGLMREPIEATSPTISSCCRYVGGIEAHLSTDNLKPESNSAGNYSQGWGPKLGHLGAKTEGRKWPAST